MKKISILIAIFTTLGLSVMAQKTKLDTTYTTVPAMYTTDTVSFALQSGWLEKMTIFTYEFVQQAAPAGVDSFTVKKQKVPIGDPSYYLLNKVTGKKKAVYTLFEFRDPRLARKD